MNQQLKYIFLLIPFLLMASTDDRALYVKKYKNESKTALIIGNSNYKYFSKLKNSSNDAGDMKSLLQSKGFKVYYLEDASLKQMEKTVRKFAYDLKNGGVGMVYYAGHGIEVDGKNYLIPVDADIPDKNEVKYEALAVNMVIDKMEDAGNRLNILVLDACRNDPFSRSGGGGLAPINNAKGMYVAYATAPGDVASDGRGKNGLFTKHLLEEMKQPQSLEKVFKNTRVSVLKESNEKQLPWTSSSVTGEFYFTIPSGDIQVTPKRKEYPKQENSSFSFSDEVPTTFSLTINTTPSNSKIVITNISSRYYDGIKLTKGKYDIKVSSDGYYSKTGTIDLKSNLSLNVSLKKEDVIFKEKPKQTYSLQSQRVKSKVNLKSCMGCHGANFERNALGKSKVVKDMTKEEVSNALVGYKNGTYGRALKGIMKGQVAKYSIVDLQNTGLGR